MSGEITTYMKRASGVSAVSVKLPHADVLLTPHGPEQQADTEATAHALLDMSRALLESLTIAAAAQDRADREHARRVEAERSMHILCGTETIASWAPPMFARERGGKVWLGSEHDWERHIALIFDSWADLRRAHPSLAPAGVKLDPDGQPAVRMRHIPIMEAAPAAGGGS